MTTAKKKFSTKKHGTLLKTWDPRGDIVQTKTGLSERTKTSTANSSEIAVHTQGRNRSWPTLNRRNDTHIGDIDRTSTAVGDVTDGSTVSKISMGDIYTFSDANYVIPSQKCLKRRDKFIFTEHVNHDIKSQIRGFFLLEGCKKI